MAVKAKTRGRKIARKVAKKVAKKSAARATKRVVKKVVPKTATKAAGTSRTAVAAKAKPRKPFKAVLKTNKTDASVDDFIAGLADAEQRADAQVLASIFAKVTQQPAKMWGGAIVGYGDYSYVGASGRSGDWFLTGFSPRKGTLTLYVLGGYAAQKPLLDKLGGYKLGGGCLYLRRLAGVDMNALNTLVETAHTRAKAIAPTMMNQRER